ncbi:DUF3223 domain-containing protein [Cephalotus follicularis]|uniref:DUF3223 domain-containing protein n=1 Tax=Cephalotus follicularis TaxID=3775 RepID=A0A1Q3C0M7_CEPFO|nr:DUF3223 domain-containing protein [Cephalotus follicularis]
MASISRTTSPLQVSGNKLPIFPRSSLLRLYIPKHGFCSLKTASYGGRVGSDDVCGPDLTRKPAISRAEERCGPLSKWVDFEDQILEDSVPLIGFVRMLLHSGKYISGDKLSPDHENIILERLLLYHPGYEKKIGCGVDYIMVGQHPEFVESRCLFIVQKNGKLVDFSYWKCIKGMIRKRYPLHAENFILTHFPRHRQSK